MDETNSGYSKHVGGLKGNKIDDSTVSRLLIFGTMIDSSQLAIAEGLESLFNHGFSSEAALCGARSGVTPTHDFDYLLNSPTWYHDRWYFGRINYGKSPDLGFRACGFLCRRYASLL